MNIHLVRAIHLIQQDRFELAEEQLRLALAQESNNAECHALLSACLTERKEFKQATEEAQQAIFHAPDLALGHLALARVLRARNRLKEARAAVHEAIRIDPADSQSFSVLASIEAASGQWKACRDAADLGLEADPEDVTCANYRALALTNLGDREAAGQSIQEALLRDPENSETHANEGWRNLHAQRPNEAMLHFQEALRLDPNSEWARAGIVEAMKSRNFIYRWMLSFFLWMQSFSPRVQLALVLGAAFGMRSLVQFMVSVPVLKPLAIPLALSYGLFVIMTWCSSTLFNLVLMLNRFGRLALTPDQRTEATLAGICVAMFPATATIVAYKIRHNFSELWFTLITTVLFVGVIIPLVTTMRNHGTRRIVAAIWTAGVLGLVIYSNVSSIQLFDKLKAVEITYGITLDSTPAGAEDAMRQIIGAQSMNMSRAIWAIMLSTWLGMALQLIPVRR